MTNENTDLQNSLTPEQLEAILAINATGTDSDGEAAHEEAEIVVTEDTADHVVH